MTNIKKIYKQFNKKEILHYLTLNHGRDRHYYYHYHSTPDEEIGLNAISLLLTLDSVFFFEPTGGV